MAARIDRSDLDTLFRSLVAYRVIIYIGGLIAITLPRILRMTAGIELAAPVRTLIVVVCLGIMILTYLGERRIGLGTDDVNPTASESASTSESGYSRRTRTTVMIGLVGLAVGIYVAIEIDTLIGLLFIAGGLLFGQSAYRGETGNE